VYNINNNTNRNNMATNNSISDRENKNIVINDSEYNSIVTNNIVNSSTAENRVNISNSMNYEGVNIYVMWYQLYNFLLGRRDANIIDLIKRNGMLRLRTKLFLVIILKLHSWCDLRLSLQKLCLGLVLDKGYYEFFLILFIYFILNITFYGHIII